MNDSIKNHKFRQVKCGHKESGKARCYRLLGYFQVDELPHVSVYYCRRCQIFHIYTLDELGIVHKSMIPAEKDDQDRTKELFGCFEQTITVTEETT